MAGRYETEALIRWNGTPIIDGVQCDELADRAAAKVWMRERGIPAKDLEWTALIKAQLILQAVVWGEESPKALAPLVEEASCRPTATDTGLAWELHAENTVQAAVRAVLAWDTLRI